MKSIVRQVSFFYAGNMVVNFGAFLYHLLMARVLGPVEYGALGSLFGLLYFGSIPMNALDILVTKTVSGFDSSRQIAMARQFIVFLLKTLTPYLLISLPIALVLSWPIKTYLHLSSIWGVFLIWIATYLLFFTTILYSSFKGLLRFSPMVFNQIIGMLFRIFLSLIIVLFVVKSHLGAQLGLTLSLAVALIILFFQAKFIFSSSSAQFDHRGLALKSLGVSSLFISASFTAMYSIDIILVKHYLPEISAGLYAALATAGKIIFFACSPLAAAIIPVVARKAHQPSSARRELILIVFLITLIGGIALAVFSFYPKLVIDSIFTSKFAGAAVFLPLMGLALLFYSLSSILANFLIAIGRIQVYYVGLAGLVLEVLLIFLFHDSLGQIVTSLTSVFGVLAASLFAFSLYATR